MHVILNFGQKVVEMTENMTIKLPKVTFSLILNYTKYMKSCEKKHNKHA